MNITLEAHDSCSGAWSCIDTDQTSDVYDKYRISEPWGETVELTPTELREYSDSLETLLEPTTDDCYDFLIDNILIPEEVLRFVLTLDGDSEDTYDRIAYALAGYQTMRDYMADYAE